MQSNFKSGWQSKYSQAPISRIKPQKKLHKMKKIALLILVIAVASAVYYGFKHNSQTLAAKTDPKPAVVAASNPIKTPQPAPIPNACAGNTLNKLIVVSINYQRMWACTYSQVALTSLVTTGYSGNPADITPTGHYQIYAKETNVTLKGTDGVTSWDDPVSYWMPFLFNQYGAYGFHDASWETPAQFGHIPITSTQASHGCVQMPLAAAKWLYDWAPVGTDITIQNQA